MTMAELAARTGEVIGTSAWFDIDQPRIDAFADVTQDHQFIHVNPAMAAMTPFGGTIAHGFLTLSLLSALLADCGLPVVARMSLNAGFNRVRFLAPVKAGKRIRGVFKLVDLVEKRPGQWQQTVEATVEIEGEDKPALVAEWLFQHFV